MAIGHSVIFSVVEKLPVSMPATGSLQAALGEAEIYYRKSPGRCS
jgi:hypothetical protein